MKKALINNWMNHSTRLIPLGLVVVALAGCGEAPRETKQVAPAAAVPVSVVTVSEQKWASTYEATGTVRAQATADVGSKLMGYVRDVKVRVGDHVQAGQILVTLDARELDVNAQRAEAALAEVRSGVPEAESAIIGAKSILNLGQSTFNRMQDLFNKKSISNQEFDEASARLKSAQSVYDMAKAKRAQLDAQAARVQQEVRSTEITRTYAEITAPFAGVVTAKPVEPGILAVPGAALLTIEREGSYLLEASVEESKLGGIRVGQPVSVTLDTVDAAFEARVSEIVPSVDAASRTNIVKINLPAKPGLRSGMFGRTSFSSGSKMALAIPLAAVVERGQLQSVLVADNGIAHTRLITIGQKNQGQVEVLSGLTAGDKIIFPAAAGLVDGAKIEVRQ